MLEVFSGRSIGASTRRSVMLLTVMLPKVDGLSCAGEISCSQAEGQILLLRCGVRWRR